MKQILIDMIKYRDCADRGCDHPLPEGVMPGNPENEGLKTVREMAALVFTCRRCTDAPCISVCPEDALQKNEDGMVVRSTLNCVACKSCVVACPFGTLMSDFYAYMRAKNMYYNLKDEQELERFISESPEGVVKYSEQQPDGDNHVFELIPGILVRDYAWEKLKNLE